MKSKEEIKKWLLENCVNADGDLDLENLDFSDFNGDVILNNLKVNGNLYQHSQTVKGDLEQYNQKVEGDLWQNANAVKGNLYQHNQTVEGEFITQTLADTEEYNIENDMTWIVQKNN